MGLLSLLKDALKLKGSGTGRPPLKQKCPKCKAALDLSMERCPSCGTHVSSMFSVKCPECGQSNPLDAKECSKCKNALHLASDSGGGGAPGPTAYKCPLCGYKADFFMLQCPSCGVKFV